MVLKISLLLALALNDPEAPNVPALAELTANQAALRPPIDGDPVPEWLLRAAVNQAEALVEREGVPLDDDAHDALVEQLKRSLEASVQVLPRKPGPARREAWASLLREVTTARFAQKVLDAWLELPAIEAGELEPTSGVWLQATQLEGAEAFAMQKVAVVEEVGGDGQTNGLIDPGEWARLEVTFSNANKLPWFSTSATAKATGCLWVDEKQSVVVGELAPGGRASVAVWVYVAERCTEASTLRLSLADTHRGTLAGALVLSVTPTSFARPHATQVRFDADALGSSDGSRLTRVGPSLRFEFVTDVRVPGDLVSSVESRWSLPKPARALFKSLTWRPAPMVPQGAGLFAAGDDLDGETIDEDKWRPLVSNTPGLARWMQAPASGRLWLAMDTTVVLSRSAAPLSATARGVKSPAPATPPLKLPLPSTTVAELVKQFVTLEPHAVAREKVDAIEAASGYEVVFNRGAFMKAYEALLAPTPPPVTPPEVPTARYVVRSYLAVPSVVVPRAAPRVERAPEPEPQPEPPPPPQPVTTKWLQLDLAGGATLFATSGTRDLPNLWNGNTFTEFPTFGVHAFIGPHLVGVVGAHYLSRSALVGNVPQDFVEVTGEIGGGYSFRWERLWVTPSAALLLRYRSHTGLQDVDALGGVVGVNARLVLTSWLGISLDLAVPLSFGGPVARGVFALVEVVGGTGFRSTLGLSLSF